VTRTDIKQLGKGLAFTSPWIVGFFAFTLLPIALSVYYSLCDYSLLQSPQYIGLKNYQDLAQDRVFWKALAVTAYYAALALPAGMMVSLGLAMMLNARIKSQVVYRAVIFLPSLVPLVASAMIWLWLYNPNLGLINLFLDAFFGIKGPGWLTDKHWTIPALTLMSLWSVGYTVVIYLAGLQDVPVELYEAAELDGAGAWRRLWHVTLPMLSPVIFFNLIMSIIGTLQIFERPLIVTNNGQPNRSAYFLTMYVYDKAFRYLQMGYASAMAWIQLIIVLALTALAFWSSRRWVHYQGK
jgi:multiple sugar transport system permease protein